MSHRLTFATVLIALAGAAAALTAAPALADEVKVYGAQEAVDPREVAEILGADGQPMKMRGLRLMGTPASKASARPGAASPAAPGEAAASAAPQDEVAPPAAPSSLSLPVRFAFDSVEILDAARPQLDAVAAGIRLLPASRRVLIEGHTDAKGPEAYNQALSMARAQAVKKYLVQVHGIDADRLRAVGLGEQKPLPGTDPHAAQNRRVQFRGA